MVDDWFRSPDWSPHAQEDFEKRLARAREHSRAQYLRIKGLALRDAGLREAAREVWLRILAGGPAYDFERAFALELLGDLDKDSDPPEAERRYRQVLEDCPDLNGTSGTVEISLSELLIDHGGEPSRGEALGLLKSWLERETSQLPNILFRWHLALIQISERMGDDVTVQRSARTALSLAARGPVFARHKDVGLVRTDSRTLRRLKQLAR